MSEPEQLPKVIGMNARRLRTEAGATLEQMAVAVGRFGGMSWSTGRVGDLESGRVAPSLPTMIAVGFALSSLLKRSVSLAELVERDGPVQVNDGLVMHGQHLVDALKGSPLTPSMWGFDSTSVQQAFSSGLDELRRMEQFAQKYGDVEMDLLLRAEEEQGLTEYRAAKDLGVKSGTLAHAAAYMWRCTFAEERDRRAGPGASAQKRGQVTRQMKDEIRQALEELVRGDD